MAFKKCVECRISSLTTEQKQEMLNLMSRFYDNVHPDVFYSDLLEKDVVLLFYSRPGKLKGFSTQKIFSHCFAGQAYRVFFSGDTIIDPGSWGSIDFPVLFIRWMLSTWSQQPETPAVWMLICKGMRVYRLLPLFFETYAPSCDRSTDHKVQALMHDLGRTRYPSRYDPDKGIVKVVHNSNYLTSRLAGSTNFRAKNRHIRFFHEKNPGYATGDELLCLAGIHPENIRPALLNRLRQNGVALKSGKGSWTFAAV